MLYRYYAYGLAIDSNLELPEVLPRTAGDGEVQVRLGEVESVPPEAISLGPQVGPRVRSHGQTVWVDYPDMGRMMVSQGRSIVIQPEVGIEERVLRLLLLGNGLGILLHQREFLALHGGVINIGGSALVFLGVCGAGKSTMTAALARRGHSVVADDVAAIRLSDNGPPQVFPGFPQLKLYPEVVETLGGDVASLPQLHPEMTKLGHRVFQGFNSEPLELKSIYILNKLDQGQGHRIERMPAPEAFLHLLTHSYSANLIQAGSSASTHFHQCTKILGTVPAYRLSREFQLSRLAEVAEAVEQFELTKQKAGKDEQ